VIRRARRPGSSAPGAGGPVRSGVVAPRFHLHTLGCPKNQVDSDKLAGSLVAGGMEPTDDPGAAELVVVNTCAFIEDARQESIEAVLAAHDARAAGARLVVTGCLAERYGDEVAAALPEVDQVAGFGVAFADALAGDAAATTPVALGPTRRGEHDGVPDFDLLRLPRPPASHPWAYVKVAEGCDRACGFCAIPSFRGPQRSRAIDDVLAEIEGLGAPEVVLVAQDLASYGRDQRTRRRRARHRRGLLRPVPPARLPTAAAGHAPLG